MKQTMALIEFMAETGLSLIEAVGMIDQLHELEKDGKNLDEISDNYLATYLRESVKRVSTMMLNVRYNEYKTRVKREINREYNVRLRVRKKSHDAREKNLTERERSAPSSPSLSPIPPIIPLISPEERESGNAPLSLRDRPPEGAHTPKNRFFPPTVGEVQDYLDEKGYKDIDAQRFVDFYESKGWMVGKNPMKDWRAAVRTWRRRSDTRTSKPAAKNPALDYAQRDYKPDDYGDGFFFDAVKEYGGADK